MLKLEYLFENFDLAREALKYYAHDPARLAESLNWFRISSNAVYPFFRGENLCFLRLCPASEKSESRVEAEIEFIEYLISHNFPAMEPLPTLSGEKCRTISTKWGYYRMSAFRAVPGNSLEDTKLTPQLIFEYGAALAKLHNLSAEFSPRTKRPSLEDISLEIREDLPEKLLPTLEKVMAELAQIPPHPRKFRPHPLRFRAGQRVFPPGNGSDQRHRLRRQHVPLFRRRYRASPGFNPGKCPLNLP